MMPVDLPALIRAHELGHVQHDLVHAVLPTWYLTLGQPGEPGGASRIGGQPDLPPGTAWPVTPQGEPLTFALQLNLRDLSTDGDHPLPSEGLLSFFVGHDEPATDVLHSIQLYAPPEHLKRCAPPTLEGANDTFSEVSPHTLNVTLGLGLPRWATSDYNVLVDGLSSEDQDRYRALERALRPAGELVGQFLGHAAGIGQDPREDAYVIREVNPAWLYDVKRRAALDFTAARQWRHLLTVESVDTLDLMIWDAGYLQVLIHEQDLQNLRFSQAYASVQTS